MPTPKTDMNDKKNNLLYNWLMGGFATNFEEKKLEDIDFSIDTITKNKQKVDQIMAFIKLIESKDI